MGGGEGGDAGRGGRGGDLDSRGKGLFLLKGAIPRKRSWGQGGNREGPNRGRGEGRDGGQGNKGTQGVGVGEGTFNRRLRGREKNGGQLGGGGEC